MKITTTLAALLIAATSSVAMAQSTTKDGATANEKPGQGTNTGALKDGSATATPPAGASSGASAGSSGDSKGSVGTTPGENKTGPTKQCSPSESQSSRSS